MGFLINNYHLYGYNDLLFKRQVLEQVGERKRITSLYCHTAFKTRKRQLL